MRSFQNSLDAWLRKVVLVFGADESWTVRDAVTGLIIFGGRGAGKTSGSGATIASSYLRLGFGGLVMTAKPDDLNTWVQDYAAECGRDVREDFVVIQPDTAHPDAVWPTALGTSVFRPFNILSYEYIRGGKIPSNVASLLYTALSSGKAVSTSDPYWDRAAKQLIKRTVSLAAEALGDIRLEDLLDIIDTAPKSLADVESKRFKAGRCYELLRLVEERRGELSVAKYGDMQQTSRFWLRRYPGLSDRVRSTVESTFTSQAEALLDSPLRELFCGETDPEALPEVSFTADPKTGRPKIIVLDVPVNLYDDVGRFAQVLYKTIWQRAILRRVKAILDGTGDWRPAFLWADEAQHFVSREDMKFEQTARSAMAATVYLTQNLPSLYAELGESVAQSLVGLFETKMFHANGDVVTNEHAERLFGKYLERFGTEPVMGEGTSSCSYSYSPLVSGSRFAELKKGGQSEDPTQHRRVGAFVFQAGRQWKSQGWERHYHEFEQKG